MTIRKATWHTNNPACSFNVIRLDMTSEKVITADASGAVRDCYITETIYWLVDEDGEHFTIERELAFSLIARYDMEIVAREIIKEEGDNDPADCAEK